MMGKSRVDSAILITFVVGLLTLAYFIMSVLLINSDPMLVGMPTSYLSWMLIERLIMIGIIFIILILITFVLLRQKETETGGVARPAAGKKPWRNEKSIRDDLGRYYRDLGALKIVLKDGVIDAKTYNERKKYLEDMIKKRKVELQKLNK